MSIYSITPDFKGNTQGGNNSKEILTRLIKIQNLVNALEQIVTLEEDFVALGNSISLEKEEINQINFEEKIREFEIELIVNALKQTKGKQIRAARLLRINKTTLNSKIKKYGIRFEKFKFNPFEENLRGEA